ncbi:class I SAM-dependent methyltransferase [Halocola ammonii]
MKNLVTPLVKYTINKAKTNKFIQNIFESPFDLSKFPESGEFTDSHGNKFVLRSGLRSKVKPGWEMLAKGALPERNDEYCRKQKQIGQVAVEKATPVISSFGKSLDNATILEVGCNFGATSYSLAECGVKKVVGSEFTGYKVESVESKDDDRSLQLEEVNAELKATRERIASMSADSDKVEFVEDDISNSRLEPGTFDIVCSWQVLEHVHDTANAFKSMYNLLKDDGILFHEYNPFFSLNGGHSFCTLDFLWGHVRLNDEDFARYLEEIRPEEKERAMSFFKTGLNRTSQKDVRTQLEEAGFEDITIIPFPKEQHLRMVDRETLTQCQRNYPNIDLLDLTSPRVYILARKKK